MGRAALGVTVLVWLYTSAAWAQPVLTVRSESRLELDVRRGSDGTLDVLGALRDDLGGELADRFVTLELSHANAQVHEHLRGPHVTTRTVRTDESGTFSAQFQSATPPTGGPVDFVIDATYEGDVEHVGTRATRFFDIDRAHVVLRLTIDDGPRMDLSAPSHDVEIVASSSSGGGGLAMTLSDEREAPLGSGITDASGMLRLELPSDALGPPAAGRLIVRTMGDSTRTEAQTEVPIVRFRPTEIRIEVSTAELRAGTPIRITGALTDGRAPLEREAIAILLGGSLIQTILTGEDGRFATTISLDDVPDVEGRVSLRARFAGDAPWVPPSDSAEISVEILRPTSLAWLWAVAAIAASSAIALWSLRRERAVSPERVSPAAGVGLRVGQRATLAANRTDVGGTVLDGITGEPIAGATVQLGDLTAVTNAQGYFALGPAARGAADLTASSPEHVLLATPISIPHRGELTAVSIRLAGRRAITFAALREVASHLSPTSDASAALTQRELLDLLRARGASPPLLPRLVGVVESACYGRSPPTDVEMAEVRTIATAIVLASAKSPPPAGSQRSPRTER